MNNFTANRVANFGEITANNLAERLMAVGIFNAKIRLMKFFAFFAKLHASYRIIEFLLNFRVIKKTQNAQSNPNYH
jgi:hypothetical protein